MQILILIKLLVAHFCADFIFQTDKLAQKKRTSWKSLALHSLINAAAAYLVVAQWTLWLLPVIIFITHFAIDFIKIHYGSDSTIWFISDQLLHLAVIAAVWILFFCASPALVASVTAVLASTKLWTSILAFSIVTMPASMFIERFFRKWLKDIPDISGLPSGGKWIGYLERLLIVVFVITGNISGVGFLMTAKSVFRFGDVSKGDLRLTEYMLLGTLLSFSIALAAGFMLAAVI